MNIKPTITKKDYEAALARLEAIFDSKSATPEGDELEILGTLIEKYEQEHYRIDYPDSIEAVRFRREQSGENQIELPGTSF